MDWQAVAILAALLAEALVIAALALKQKDQEAEIKWIRQKQSLEGWNPFRKEREINTNCIKTVKEQLYWLRELSQAGGMPIQCGIEISDMILRYADWIAKNDPQYREQIENENRP